MRTAQRVLVEEEARELPVVKYQELIESRFVYSLEVKANILRSKRQAQNTAMQQVNTR